MRTPGKSQWELLTAATALVVAALACSAAGDGPARTSTAVPGSATAEASQPPAPTTPVTEPPATAGATAAPAPESHGVILLTSDGKGVQGDLQKWDGQTLTALTSWKYNYMPVVSPDGQWVAYLSTAEAVIDAGQSGASSGVPPANIWIINLASGEATRVAGQPDGVTYPSDRLISRNQPPSWAPDSSALAWVEADSSGERLQVYTIATKATQTLALNLPAQCCEGAFRVTFWGTNAAGLAIDSFNGDSSDTTEQVVYPTDRLLLNLGQPVSVPLRTQVYGWVVDGGKPYLAGIGDNGADLVDLATGAHTQAAGRLALGPSSGPLSVVSSADGLTWTLRDGGKDVAAVPFSPFLGGAAISPDGRQAVFLQGPDLTHPAAMIYANGQTTPIPLDQALRVLAVAWGPLVWHIEAGQ